MGNENRVTVAEVMHRRYIRVDGLDMVAGVVSDLDIVMQGLRQLLD